MAIRLANVLRGLARVGDLDVFLVPGQDRWELPVIPPDVPVRRFHVVARPSGSFALPERLVWWLGGRLPSHFVGRDYREVQARFRAWTSERYDVVWFSTLRAYVPLKPVVDAPAIVDFDDLEDRKLIERLTLLNAARDPQAPGGLAAWRDVLVGMQARKNARLWRDLQRSAARSVEAAVVCSDLDRQYLGAPNVYVVPNGYAFQPHPVGREGVGLPPVIMLPGMFRYPPNADAACWLVGAIAPIVRRRVPHVQVRLVGLANERVQNLHRPPEVIVTGFVPDIRAELARADVIAVPIRYGGGTRIKILEGFAHRIPVVSTSKGAEGIDAVSGRELLIEDTPDAFADACVRLLTEPQSRRVMVEAAHALFREKYLWDRIHGEIARLAEAVARRAPFSQRLWIGAGYA
ncbi:MAG: glycosyltransferase family 4 protein [Armatimonadota bacterium]|nr:glycosyltransferase family 4 protein [Armatimonadota bacterium]